MKDNQTNTVKEIDISKYIIGVDLANGKDITAYMTIKK